MKTQAFIFDLDGVLTDTAAYHYQAWKSLADRLSLKFDQKDNERLKGVSRTKSLEIILEINEKEKNYTEAEKIRLAEEKNEEYVKLIQQITPSDILPGILPFLDEAQKLGLKLAVASASKNAKTVLAGLQIETYFDYIADASKIKHTKPDPEVFLDCANNLKLSPEACIGFEDAQAGIEAIHAAGMYAVGIGVEVVTQRPDLELRHTNELNCQKILNTADKKKE